MITSQEISKFVAQPTPRDVPKNILHAAGAPSYFLATLMGLLLILSFFLVTFLFSLMGLHSQHGGLAGDFLLNIGKRTAQGIVIDWEGREARFARWPAPRLYYRVGISFHTSDGEITTDCYVTDRRSIPGWGQIPESRIEQTFGAIVRLKEPFPVIIEYAPWDPSIARAVGTQASLMSAVFYLVFFSVLGTIPLTYAMFWYIRKKLKRTLAEGLFAMGRVSEVCSTKEAGLKVSVSFTDQDGKARTGYRTVTKRVEDTCRKWKADDREVGLLYLPGREDVIITDLWVVG